MKILTKKLKLEWIKALRGRKFKQGSGVLIWYNEYCCLGVLKEIGDIESDSNDFLVAKGDGTRSCIKGLTMRVQERLAAMNDKPKSFKIIADWIEKKLNPKL